MFSCLDFCLFFAFFLRNIEQYLIFIAIYAPIIMKLGRKLYYTSIFVHA